jgi:catechol 2,3-dioxygenase-like lactoylglutathione lyase family enzyme
MKIQELGHVVLYVRDLQRSRHFYRDVLGFRELTPVDPRGGRVQLGSHPSRTAASFKSGTTRPRSRRRRVGFYHMGLKSVRRDDELRDALTTVQEGLVSRSLAPDDHT